MKLRDIALCLLRVAVLALPCVASNADNGQLEIESDDITFNNETGVSVFEGNVVLQRDGLKITAERVEYFREEPEHRYAIAFGSPVRFVHQSSETDAVTEGSADKALYRFDEGELQLSGDVAIDDGQTALRANEVAYDTDTGQMRAISGDTQGTESGRVRSTIVIDDDN